MCGLKLVLVDILRLLAKVTPFVGVWIETFVGDAANRGLAGHTLRGCVD